MRVVVGLPLPLLEAAASVISAEEASDSLGFDVGRHGWAFGNYAASESGRFSVVDAVTLFGDAAVCVESEGARRRLLRSGLRWLRLRWNTGSVKA